MFKNSTAIIAGAVALSCQIPAHAFQIGDSVNANLIVNLLSDYRSNGASQSRGDPALQGELFVMHDSGLIGGLWMSSVDFGTKTRREEGGYIGIYKELTEDLKVTATVGRFMYPKNSTYSLNEFYSVVEYKNFRYNLVYDWAMEAPNATYQYLGYTFPLPYDTKLYIEYGYHNVGDVLYGASGKISDNYQTRKASLKKSFVGIDWSVTYIDTSLSDNECLYFMGYEDSCSAGVVFGATKVF
ncbi:TorF family putative porin [Pseudomonas sp. C11]|uniref:TorF family putative porin n=1 Tax=Pseudomonas sp. C11 TaxID=3075550 RepID=UPI002AFF50C5|nr:TorF family putative porin [Pseudomonas sp. C11]